MLFLVPFLTADLVVSPVPQILERQEVCLNTPPPQVINLFPPPNSNQASVDSVGVDLLFTPEKSVERQSIRLFINGVDITSKALFRGTRDVPPSNITISYTTNSFQPGIYQAEIHYNTMDGSTNCYRWTFQIERSHKRLLNRIR